MAPAEIAAMSVTLRKLVGAVEDKKVRAEDSEATTVAEELSSPWAQDGADTPMTVEDAFDAIRDGAPLYRLPKELRSDKQVVLAAIDREGAYCFDYIMDRQLRCSDRDVVMALVSADGSMLEAADQKLRADREVVKRALRTCGTALKFAAKQLQDDKELRNLAGHRAKEEHRLLKRFTEKACGPGIARCM